MQAKRIDQTAVSLSALGIATAFLETPAVPREETNFHNIWIGGCAEPLVADANAQGGWVLFVDPAGVDTLFTDTVIDSELESNKIIGPVGRSFIF